MERFTRRDMLKSLGGALGSAALSQTIPQPAFASQQLEPHPIINDQVKTSQSRKAVQIENGKVCARFELTDAGVEQTYFARKNEAWVLLVKGFRTLMPHPQVSVPLYSDQGSAQQYRLLAGDALDHIQVLYQSQNRATVLLSGTSSKNRIQQIVSLEPGVAWFHVEVHAELADSPPKLEYLLSSFIFVGGTSPDFTHVPAMKRAADDVIGDRIFNSPVALIQEKRLLAALLPDLDLLNSEVVYAKNARPVDGCRDFRVPYDPDKISFPAVLDMDLHSGVTPNPLFSFGFADFVTEQHVYWRHENRAGDMVRELSSNRVRYGFDLFLRADAPQGRGYQEIAQHIWKRYGSEYLRRPRPQAMPLVEYAKVCLPAAFAYRGDTLAEVDRYRNNFSYDASESGPLPTWLEFELGGSEVGGIRATPTQWYSDIQYSAWWNNARDAVGLYWWGKQIDSTLLDKARRMISLALDAPQKEGIFPSVFRFDERRWIGCYWKFAENFNPDWNFPDRWDPAVFPKFWDYDSDYYQTSAASLTSAHLLRYRRLCEDNPRILPYVLNYGDFLLQHIPPHGCVPAWFTADLRTTPALEFNSEGGVHIWVLCELYAATGDKKYLNAAERIAGFLIEQVLPRQRWSDFETFYSCAIKPENVFDQHTGQYPQNTISMMWAVHGLTALARATSDPVYLAAAEAVADYSLFYQACWQPHFMITAYAFGGFRSQNSDAEWLDMRSSAFAEAFVDLAELTHRQDLYERAVAAMRSAFAIINHPRLIENGIFRFPRYPLGLEPENIDHEGLPQLPLRSGFDWGEGGALTGAATLLRTLGGVYIDVPHNTAVGIDGVAVRGFKLEHRQIELSLINQIAELAYPFNDKYKLNLRVVGLDPGNYTLIINGNSPRSVTNKELEWLPIEV